MAAALRVLAAAGGLDSGEAAAAASAIHCRGARGTVQKGVSNGMLLYVRSRGGEVTALELAPDATAGTAARQCGMHRLSFCGEELAHDVLLSDAGVTAEATLDEASREPVKATSTKDARTQCGNAYAGFLFHVEAKRGPIAVTSLWLPFHWSSTTREEVLEVEVWATKAGWHDGIRNCNPEEWELVGTGQVSSVGRSGHTDAEFQFKLGKGVPVTGGLEGGARSFFVWRAATLRSVGGQQAREDSGSDSARNGQIAFTRTNEPTIEDDEVIVHPGLCMDYNKWKEIYNTGGAQSAGLLGSIEYV